MSEGHPGADRLHDHADGLLGPAETAGVTAHLEACAACAADAEAIRQVRAELSALPRAVDPGRDLRPGIRALRARSRRRRVGLAAAALVVVAAGLTGVILRGASDPPMSAATADPADETAAVVLALDREYERAGEELKARVEAATPGAGTPAARLIAADLAAVERALVESRAALREDPMSPVVRELVLAAHRQRLDVLRRAAVLASEIEEAS